MSSAKHAKKSKRRAVRLPPTTVSDDDESEVKTQKNVDQDKDDDDDNKVDDKEKSNDDDDDNDDEGSDSEAKSARRKRAKGKIVARKKPAAKKPGKKRSTKKKDGDDEKKEKKPPRLSAATLKTRMLPYMLQNPKERKKIWTNLMQLMIRRGYEWVTDRNPPTEVEQLLPNPKGLLGFFHMHAVAPGKEPVHVIFCSKAGEPTLKSLQYPSRHIIIVSDQLTSRARAALALLPVKSPPTPDAKQDAFAKEAKQDAKQEKTAGASAAKEKDVEKDVAKDATKDGRAMTGYELKDVYIEAFVSLYFMFQLLKQRYLKCVNFSQLESKELDQVFDVFEKNRNLSHLPRMVETDPVARYLRLPTMSVVKQTRLSSSSGMQQSFRVVVREIKS